MKTLRVSFLNEIDVKDVEKLHSIMNEQQQHALEFHLWKAGNSYRPKVSFSIAYNNRSVFLRFFVEEKEIRANVTTINGPVWEDSCVEFFVSFDERGYYNFECNCLGTVLAAFGKDRNGRAFLPEELLKEIQTSTKLNKKGDLFSWEMVIVIKVELFVHHPLLSLSEINCKANFYKCGDGLIQPHYLSWANIESRTPNFHLPEFFGKLFFV